MSVPVVLAAGLLGALALVPGSLSAQRGGMFLGSSEGHEERPPEYVQ